MPVIRVTIEIAAPPELCFDLARSVDAHMASTGATGERAVAGVTTGLIGPDQEVTWSARHFGVRQRLTSRITIFDPPRHFRDSMVRGAFARFDHDHFFERTATGTLMTGVSSLTSPTCGGAGIEDVYELRVMSPKVIVATTNNPGTSADTVMYIRGANCASADSEMTCSDDVDTANKTSSLTQSIATPGTHTSVSPQ